MIGSASCLNLTGPTGKKGNPMSAFPDAELKTKLKEIIGDLIKELKTNEELIEDGLKLDYCLRQTFEDVKEAQGFLHDIIAERGVRKWVSAVKTPHAPTQEVSTPETVNLAVLTPWKFIIPWSILGAIVLTGLVLNIS